MARTSSKPRAEYAIQTVVNALRTLEAFDTRPEIGVSELSRLLGLHKNNAFRLLATLHLEGYVDQNPDNLHYRLSPRCLDLARSFTRHHELMESARPILEDLAGQFGETAHLGQLQDFEVVHLDGVLSKKLLLTGLRVGERIPAHASALGKTLLAGLLDDSQQAAAEADEAAEDPRAALEALQAMHLERSTRATVVDTAKLVEELRSVQLRGFAVDVDEYVEGMSCVASPVRDASGRVVAALSVSAPSQRLDEDRLHGDTAEGVMASAETLSRELGANL